MEMENAVTRNTATDRVHELGNPAATARPEMEMIVTRTLLPNSYFFRLLEHVQIASIVPTR